VLRATTDNALRLFTKIRVWKKDHVNG
jgi:hypothetical protein